MIGEGDDRYVVLVDDRGYHLNPDTVVRDEGNLLVLTDPHGPGVCYVSAETTAMRRCHDHPAVSVMAVARELVSRRDAGQAATVTHEEAEKTHRIGGDRPARLSVRGRLIGIAVVAAVIAALIVLLCTLPSITI